MAKVIFDGKTYEYEVGTSYEKIAEDMQSTQDSRIILVNVDGKLNELSKTLEGDCTIDFRTVSSRSGFHTFRRTACIVMLKAVNDLYGKQIERVKIEFSVSKGYYCTVNGTVNVDNDFIEKVSKRMQEIIDANLPITKKSYHISDALKIFAEAGMKDKEKLFKYRRSSRVNIYSIEDYKDYFYGYMAPSTGYVNAFKLYQFEDGFVLQMPTKANTEVVPPFEPQLKLFNTMKKADKSGIDLGVETVGDLNECICRGDFEQLRLVTEALQEGNISDIATDIVNRGKIKFVMIAGPSSSGKTSFSYRLSTQLKAHGLNPHPIGLDNYYVNREDCPKDENGNYDFECLESLDVEGFNKDMTRLLNGETVDIPVFNFKTGLREYHNNFMTLKEDDVLVIEGIHGLNEKMSYTLPKESKYKVYISALTSLNVDEHNRIPTTDVRLIRRMVRDNRTRGTKASGTLAMWESVRRGEEKYIFPFQELADAHFNSALLYELAILKQFAEPLLFGIEESDPTYHEAHRLLKFLDYFLGVTSEDLPNNSLLREFVGGSVFNV
ncbi:MAG: nucleoside kinase [Lachnospiraceae bacterium]|nr:nucleoside kinase [Lachnospiraceae bacterium]